MGWKLKPDDMKVSLRRRFPSGVGGERPLIGEGDNDVLGTLTSPWLFPTAFCLKKVNDTLFWSSTQVLDVLG